MLCNHGLNLFFTCRIMCRCLKVCATCFVLAMPDSGAFFYLADFYMHGTYEYVFY